MLSGIMIFLSARKKGDSYLLIVCGFGGNCGHLATSLLIWNGAFKRQKLKPVVAFLHVVCADKIFREKEN